MTASLIELGFEAIAVDHKRVQGASAPTMIADLTTSEGSSLVTSWLQLPECIGFFAAPPCGTCSRAREITSVPGPPPLRTDEEPDGIKVRLIDDFTASGINLTVQAGESPKPRTVDVAAGILLEALRIFPGTHFKGRAYDLVSAYRQFAIKPDAKWAAYISVWDHTAGSCWGGLDLSPACLAVWRIAIRFRLPQDRTFGLAHRLCRTVAHLELLL